MPSDQGGAAADDAEQQSPPPPTPTSPTTTPPPPPPPLLSLLSSRLRVVLVSPRTSANVGAACRASSNFGVDDLVVVSPRCDPFDGESAKLSRGVECFERMRVAADLDEALEGAAAAVGVSRRTGGARRAYEGVRELLGAGVPGVRFAPRGRRQSKGGGGGGGDSGDESSLFSPPPPLPPPPPPLALVFGREESGLTAAELARCSASLALRTCGRAPSLNLGAAVAVTLALLQEEAARADEEEEREGEEEEKHEENPPLPSLTAPPSAVDALVRRVAELAFALKLEPEPRETAGGGGAHGRKPRLAGHARALLTRARASGAEVGAMHALLRAAEQRLLAVGGGGGGGE